MALLDIRLYFWADVCFLSILILIESRDCYVIWNRQYGVNAIYLSKSQDI